MSLEPELLWSGILLLLLLGAAAGLCVRCSHPGSKKSGKIYEQRNLKDKLLQFSPSAKGSESPRYQNFCRGSRHGSDAAYVEPITADYYNWGQCQKALEEEDDSSSYQNVLICKPSSAKLGEGADRGVGRERPYLGRLKATPHKGITLRCPKVPLGRALSQVSLGMVPNEGGAGELPGPSSPAEWTGGPKECPHTDDEDSEDYQNSMSIQHWRESRRIVELMLSEVSPSPVGSPDEDGSEPDYVNGDVESGTA
ncbi:PREDICTED: linker for activation of T-cells family member 2 [Chrysochloris asiatica]|uniref:Linker for activation of T-cells family member 2 n=1 Tax=Chrysochloris asiatica TaxID=185453 RepID=A0A9B0WJH3_CHRAS|nr:PREDICTED: linker for activation of T-cells family member 2 [Chrysochloris asiatica]